MKMTQKDFEERLAKIDDGTADDEDRRLVKHYRREGFKRGDEPVDGSWLADQQAAVNDDTDNIENDQYTEMEYRDLQTLARQRHLNAGGSATDLADRLREDDKKRRDAAAGA
jgi:hypothetical protein